MGTGHGRHGFDGDVADLGLSARGDGRYLRLLSAAHAVSRIHVRNGVQAEQRMHGHVMLAEDLVR